MDIVGERVIVQERAVRRRYRDKRELVCGRGEAREEREGEGAMESGGGGYTIGDGWVRGL